jgi:hypothetical protein
MKQFLATGYVPDVTLFTDAGTAITAIAVAFVAALALAIGIPVARKVYKMVKSAIGGA